MKERYKLIVRLPAEMEFLLKRRVEKNKKQMESLNTINDLIIEAVKSYFKKGTS